MLLAVDSSTQWIGLALYDGAMISSEAISSELTAARPAASSAKRW